MTTKMCLLSHSTTFHLQYLQFDANEKILKTNDQFLASNKNKHVMYNKSEVELQFKLGIFKFRI